MEQRRIERYFGRIVKAIYGRIVRQQKDNKIHALQSWFLSPPKKGSNEITGRNMLSRDP